MIFTTGNLLTLGIVLVTLILFRQFDRNNRSLEKLRKYGERLRDELGAFVAEREGAVKDYAIELDVQRKAAKELLNRIASLDEGFTQRADAIVKIDERIASYDKSLEELLRMTARAQENLDRLRSESTFTDGVLKRVKEAKDQLEKVERSLQEVELRFERDNAASLERATETTIAAVRATASDLQETVETIERRVEDHREAIIAVEASRAEQLEKDRRSIQETLDRAGRQAAEEADKLEGAAFAKLKEQALERSKRFHDAVEEKLGQFQEASKARLAEVQGLVKNFKSDWQKEAGELAERQKATRDEWKKDYAELAAIAKAGREEWKRESSEIRSATETLEKEFKQRAAALVEATKRVEQEALAAAAEDASRRQGEIRAALETSVAALSSRLNAEGERVGKGVRDLELASEELSLKLDSTVAELTARIASSTEAAERAALADTEARLEAYRGATNGRFDRLEALADDVGRLDAELRRSMGDVEARVREDFSLFQTEAEASRASQQAEFSKAVAALRSDMDGVERELNQLKARAYENVSEKLKLFEDDFFTDLSKRGEEIERRLEGWKESLESSLAQLAEEGARSRAAIEASYAEELKQKLSAQTENSIADLERLKERTGAFEEGVREQLAEADQSLSSFKEQLAQELEEVRSSAASATKSEMARHGLEMAELLKADQRNLEASLKALVASVEERKQETAEKLGAVGKELETWKVSVSKQLREAGDEVEEARRRGREVAAESDERLAAVRTALEGARAEAATYRNELMARTEEQAKTVDLAVKDLDRRLKDFVVQTKLFDRADELRVALERKIEDLGADLERLDQRRTEAAELESQFVKIKRLEDEVNAKMTRFLSERHRIELMESDFKRLLQTAQSVDDKLVQVTSSDDTLQAMQAQLRRLEDATKAAEDRYDRLEKKARILDETADGIDRNFQSLREAEAASKHADEELRRISAEILTLRESVDRIAQNKERADEAVDKLSTLDSTLADIEKRIEAMQTAREWLARTETRLSEVSKQAQDQVKIMGTLLKAEGGKGAAKDRGAPPIGVRETVVKLAHQGWSVDEIARAVKLSKGEVELILEISPKG